MVEIQDKDKVIENKIGNQEREHDCHHDVRGDKQYNILDVDSVFPLAKFLSRSDQPTENGCSSKPRS